MNAIASKDVYGELLCLTKDLLYFSESEMLVTVHDWGQTESVEMYQKISEMSGVPVKGFDNVSAELFFDGIITAADPADEIMMVNARRFMELYDCLKNGLDDLQVIRAGKIRVHIFITGLAPDKTCIVLHTTAVAPQHF